MGRETQIADGGVAVILCTYNEAENLPIIVGKILSLGEQFSVIVVDDNSPDGTGQIAEELAKQGGRVAVVHRAGKLGLGTAYLAGFSAALAHGKDIGITMDADLSHDPDLLPEMVRLAQHYDIVVGSRLAKGGGLEGLSRTRRVFSRLANMYLRAVLRMSVSDFTSGYRAYTRRAMEALAQQPLRGRGHSGLPELLFRAKRLGLSIGEMPIHFRPRHSGQSKVSAQAIWDSLLVPWRVRFSCRGEARTGAEGAEGD